MGHKQKNQASLPNFRDIFLSHRATDDGFVWKLTKDIEKHTYQERQLLSWVDEAEIRPGQSLVGMVNKRWLIQKEYTYGLYKYRVGMTVRFFGYLC